MPNDAGAEHTMDAQLKDKTALVTGASAGIGRACAKALALEGVQVAIVARRGELLEQLSAEIVAAGGVKPTVIVADMKIGGAHV